MNATLLQIALSSLLIPLATGGAVADSTHPTTPPDPAGQTNQANQAKQAEPAREPRPPLTVNLNIESQLLGNALNEFGQQTGLQVIFFYSDVPLLTSPRLAGKFHPRVALEALLADTPLAYRFINPRTVAIVAKADQRTQPFSSSALFSDAAEIEAVKGDYIRLANASPRQMSDPALNENKQERLKAANTGATKSASIKDATPEILVEGSRILNTDIPRSRDDVQPYIVLSADDIARSQATNVEELLRTRLPMNAVKGVPSQSSTGLGNLSNFNLRGLGTNQTLVLVDGRRLPGPFNTSFSSDIGQPDINGIPMSAIERIEILPSTASGTHGGGATGGVINIITRREYEGLEVTAKYSNPFDTEASNREFSIVGGFSLEAGRTGVFLTASRSDSSALRVGERNFAKRAREKFLANAPDSLLNNPFLMPWGGTTNISSIDGSNLVLDDGTPINSPRTHVPVGYLGLAIDGGDALATNAGQYNFDIGNDLNGKQQTMIASPTVESISLNMRRLFSKHIDAYLDLSWVKNNGTTFNTGALFPMAFFSESSPGNPFANAVVVSFPVVGLSVPSIAETETKRATTGVIARLPSRWSIGADFSSSQVSYVAHQTLGPVTFDFFTDVDNGTISPFQDLNVLPWDYSSYLVPSPNALDGPFKTNLNDITLRASGPIYDLSGGSLTLSALVGHREEKVKESFSDFLLDQTTIFTSYFPSRAQRVTSYYLEAAVPFVSAANPAPLLQGLEIIGSIRHDRYKTRSVANPLDVPSRDAALPEADYFVNSVDATDYTVGLKYSPLKDITIRASMGTGFLPPAVSQIASTRQEFFPVTILDPKRGGAPTTIGPFFAPSGGNPNLLPEESKSRSTGFIFTPRFMPGLRLSIDYTEINKTDEISTLGFQQMIDLEDFLPGRVTRGDNLTSDPAGWAGPIVGLDTSLVNLAKTKMKAYDIQGDYVWQAKSVGEFRFYAIASRLIALERRITSGAEALETVGFSDGPLKWRGNAGITWYRGAYTLSWNMQYYDSYLVYPSTFSFEDRTLVSTIQGSSTIPSQSYHDVAATFKFDESSAPALLSNTIIRVGVQNIFNSSPPIIATMNPASGSYSFYGDPRLRRYSISVSKGF